MESAASVRRDISAKNVAEGSVSFALNQPHGCAWIVTTVLSGKLQRWNLSNGQPHLNCFS